MHSCSRRFLHLVPMTIINISVPLTSARTHSCLKWIIIIILYYFYHTDILWYILHVDNLFYYLGLVNVYIGSNYIFCIYINLFYHYQIVGSVDRALFTKCKQMQYFYKQKQRLKDVRYHYEDLPSL